MTQRQRQRGISARHAHRPLLLAPILFLGLGCGDDSTALTTTSSS